MAYYDNLKIAWNSATQPPTGVTGSGLLPTDTTDQKLAKVNAWTVTGQVPTTFYPTGNEILNCINYPEFKALTPTQQANILAMLQTPGPLLGGSANQAFIIDGMIIDYFPIGGPTLTALQALAKAVTITWCQNNFYPYFDTTHGNLSRADTDAAGLV